MPRSLNHKNSERLFRSSGVVIPRDVPMGETMDVKDTNASLCEIGRSSRGFEFG